MSSAARAPDQAQEPTSGVLPIAAARLLVVEDEQIVALDLCATLERLGYVVIGVAANAQEAMAKARSEKPDVVLMDVRLRGPLDGVQIATLLRVEHDAAIVFLTANGDIATLQRALKTAPGGFLTKPYDDRTLHTTIEVALAKRGGEQSLRAENLVLRRESNIDALTGLHNRRHLDQILAQQLAFAQRDHHGVALIFSDLDHFKRVNDEHGHAAGDQVLRQVSQLLRARLRTYDIVCRYGGEELIVVVPGAGSSEGRGVAEALRAAVAQHAFDIGAGEPLRLTASFGVAAFPEHATDAAKLIAQADRAMYSAKSAGRDRVVMA